MPSNTATISEDITTFKWTITLDQSNINKLGGIKHAIPKNSKLQTDYL